MILTIILGYGIFFEQNSQYRKYLDQCVSVINETNTTHIITTGGCTNNEYPNLSEASTVAEYIKKHVPHLSENIFLEENSLTTLQNIEFAKDLISQKQILPEKIYITCDSIRASKVFYLALTILCSLFRINLTEEEIYLRLGAQVVKSNTLILENISMTSEYIDVKGIALGRSMQEIAEQIPSSMLEVAFLKYPAVHEMFIKVRKEKLKLE